MKIELPPKLPDQPLKPPAPRRLIPDTKDKAAPAPKSSPQKEEVKPKPPLSTKTPPTPPVIPPPLVSEPSRVVGNPIYPVRNPSKPAEPKNDSSDVRNSVIALLAVFGVIFLIIIFLSNPPTTAASRFTFDSPTPTPAPVQPATSIPNSAQIARETPTPTPVPTPIATPIQQATTKSTPPLLLPPSPTPRSTPYSSSYSTSYTSSYSTPSSTPDIGKTPSQPKANAYRVSGLDFEQQLQVLSDTVSRTKIVALWKNGVDGIHVTGNSVYAGGEEWSRVERRGVKGWVLTRHLSPYVGETPEKTRNTGSIRIPQGVRMELRTSSGFNSPVEAIIQSGNYSYELIEQDRVAGDNWVRISVAGYTGWLSQNGFNRIKR